MNKPGDLPYYLIPSPLYTSEKKHYARTVFEQTADMDSLICTMAGRNTIVSRPDVVAVMELLKETIADELHRGKTVDLGFVTLRLNIKGSFKGPDDRFDQKRHRVHLAVRVNKEYEQTICFSAHPVKTTRSPGQPHISYIMDFTTGQKDTALTAGGIIEIKGRNLLFDRDNPECGVFAVPSPRPSKPPFHYKHTELVRGTERTLRVRFPETIPPGIYQIEVRKQYFSGLQTTGRNKDLEVKKSS